jgi:hypothetical protein
MVTSKFSHLHIWVLGLQMASQAGDGRISFAAVADIQPLDPTGTGTCITLTILNFLESLTYESTTVSGELYYFFYLTKQKVKLGN